MSKAHKKAQYNPEPGLDKFGLSQGLVYIF